MFRYRFSRAFVPVALALVIAAPLFAAGDIEIATAEAEVFEMGLSGNPDTLDPHATSGTLTFQVIRSAYDTLVEPNREGRIVGALAESWEVSADNLVWTFRLRPGVTFHNGDTFTSADVEATLDRLRAEETASPKASEFEAISSIETPDEHTVVFHLSAPYAPLLASLASGWGAILPKALIDSGHDFANEPVGTGPFVFKEWIKDNRIVYEANSDYWMDGRPSIDGVVFNIIPEPAVQVQGLLTGELDAIDSVGDQNLAMLESDPNTKVEEMMSSLVMVLAMNTGRDPLSDLRVRQAIAQAIDKQAALDVAYGGGVPVATFMDYTDPYYVDMPDPYPYDPAKARSTLSASSYDGEELILALPQNYEAHVRAGELYHEMLTQIGMNVTIRLVDWPTWISDVYRGGNYDLTVIGHTGKLDPDGRLGGYGTGRGYVAYKNDRVAELFEEAQRVVDFEARRRLYSEGLRIMAREIPHVYVGTSYRRIGLRSDVTGFHMDSKLDTFDFRYVEM